MLLIFLPSKYGQGLFDISEIILLAYPVPQLGIFMNFQIFIEITNLLKDTLSDHYRGNVNGHMLHKAWQIKLSLLFFRNNFSIEPRLLQVFSINFNVLVRIN